MVFISVFVPLDEAAQADKEHKETDSEEDRVENSMYEGRFDDSRPQEVNCLLIIKLLNPILKPDNGHVCISGILKFCNPLCSKKRKALNHQSCPNDMTYSRKMLICILMAALRPTPSCGRMSI